MRYLDGSSLFPCDRSSLTAPCRHNLGLFSRLVRKDSLLFGIPEFSSGLEERGCEELSLLKLERDMWKVEVDESCRLQDILESSEALRWRDQDPRLVS
ncbi:hypothetical protein TNCT_318791 [Trichonephila clavata]|uniref:Uncharacterized protein n=1 Tax=Trichonephila clavata TaxID=2740835 RepID=A0A8X6HGT9_TRICU|nr:hypothetical protein TNCT_318791 [Trichonephila clavata]